MKAARSANLDGCTDATCSVGIVKCRCLRLSWQQTRIISSFVTMMTSLYDGVETESYRITLNHFTLTFYTVDIQHQTLESVIISLDKATYSVSCVMLAV